MKEDQDPEEDDHPEEDQEKDEKQNQSRDKNEENTERLLINESKEVFIHIENNFVSSDEVQVPLTQEMKLILFSINDK